MPKVSILTTVYNREKYIAECIESVLESSFQDWEMIIVDDQSKDKSVEIAQSYAKKDERIKVYVNEVNLGDYPNRNKAASYAKGKYLKYLDADDLIYPHGLEVMVKTMEEFPTAVLGISQKVEEDIIPFPFLLSPREIFLREYLQRGLLGVAPTRTIIKRDIFETVGRFSGKRFIGDKEMWYKLSLNYPLVKMETNLVYWREHEGQEFDLGMKSNTYTRHNYFLKMTFLKKTNIPLSQYEKKRAEQIVKKNAIKDILRIAIKQREWLKAHDLYRELRLNILDFLVLLCR